MPQSGWPANALRNVMGVRPRLCGGPIFGELSGGNMNGRWRCVRYAGAVVGGREARPSRVVSSPSVNHLLPCLRGRRALSGGVHIPPFRGSGCPKRGALPGVISG